MFSEPAVNTESKMIIFTGGPLQGFQGFVSAFSFQVNRLEGGDD